MESRNLVVAGTSGRKDRYRRRSKTGCGLRRVPLLLLHSVSESGIGVPRGAALRPDLVERPLPMIKSKILYTFTLELYNHWILKTLLGAPPSLSHPDRDRVVLLQRLCCAWAGENIPCCSLPAEEDVQQVVPRGRPAAAASWLTARVAVSVPLPLPLPVCSLSIITVHMKESPIASTSRQTLRKSCSFLHGCV